MTKEQFKNLIRLLKLISDNTFEYNKFGIDLYGGKYSILDPVYKTINLLLDSIYNDLGREWIDWFCYDCDFGEKMLEATYDGKLICQTVDELYNHIEQYKIK